MTLHRGTLLRWAIGALLVVALGILLLWVASRAAADFPTNTTLLSDSTVCDLEPRAAISDDGQWIATAWIQGQQYGDGCVSRGAPVLKWATEGGAQANWTTQKTLSLPTAACAVHTDVALDSTTAHVAASYWLPCDSQDRASGVRYFTCDLATQSCQARGDVTFESETTGKLLSDVRIVLDNLGNPHITYARGNSPGLDAGDILYARRLPDGSWSSSVIVSETGSGKFDGAYRPAMAAADGRIHIVWERHRDWTDNQGRGRLRGDVQYRYCDAFTGSCGTGSLLTYLYPEGLLDDTTYPVPNVDAHSDRVVLAWNVCADVDTAPPCESFYLLYARSNDNGQTWPTIYPKEVGSDLFITYLGLSTRTYSGSDDWTALDSEYASYARPSVALDSSLLPHVGWQVESGGGYVISTTHAVAGSETSLSWADITGWQLGVGADTRVAGTLLSVDPSLDAGGLHVVHMNAWSEYVMGTPWSRSQIYYDYLGSRKPHIEAQTPSSSHELPMDRAAPVRARVTDLGGNPVAEVEVTFGTDFGSFSYYGYGQDKTTRLTDSDGWASAFVYANLAGSASVQAWLDANHSLMVDEGEAGDLVTRTWTMNVTPAIHTSTDWSIAGDLITTTVAYHPYETPSWPEQATPYTLWWCPHPSNPHQETSAEVLHEFAVSPATWSLDSAILQIPWNADGQYRLESFDGEPTCGSPDSVAASSYISITDTPPPGTPWLTVSDARPSPGDTLDVKFWYHDTATYELWWCPASGDAEPVTEHVGNPAVTGDEFITQATVPSGIRGHYRFESHRTGGACGQVATREAISSLLAPKSGVFLPLVMR